MSPSSRRSFATSEPRASSPSSDRKRKRSNLSALLNDSSTESTPKASLSSPSKHSLDAAAKAVETKRRKPDSAAEPRQERYNTMYTFSSRAPAANTNGVIDLTNGTTSPSSPNRRANSIIRPVAGKPGLNPQTGARKLVVKNLKSQPAWDSKGYLESIWTFVDKALDIIFNDGKDNFSKEDLYRGVENVCRQGGASTLFSRLESRCQNHVEHNMLRPLLDKCNSENITLLRAAIGAWKRWVEQMVTIRAIFFFLDRSYLLSSSKPTLDQFTPELFRQVVFSNQTLKPKVVDGACDLVAADRIHTDAFDRDLFREAVLMFNQLSEYTASFEPRFLGLTEAYISQWSDQKASEMTVPEYVSNAEHVIAKEISRCDEFQLSSSTRRALLALLEEALVEAKDTYLTEYEPLSNLLDNAAIADLTALYSLLKRRRLGSNLRPAFEKWVDKTGTQIVFATEADKMITHLLSLKIRLDLVWRKAFQRDESLGHGLRETFEAFMNKTKKGDATWGTDNTKVGEMIAKHVDLLLRNGAKAIPDELTARRSSSVTAALSDLKATTAAPDEDNEDAEVDEDAEVNVQLDQVLDLFRFVHGKAVFEAFYKKDLARRLLMGRSASADAERSMLTRLKAECGSGFTQNLEQMFQDVELSREEMMSYKQRLGDRVGYEKGKGVDLSVNILSAAAWPTYPEIPVVIPSNVKRAIDSFELHYKSKHSGRKLDWKHGLAHCQMRATFNTGSKELVVSSFQAVVLLLFNGLSESDHLTYSHILSESGLPEAEVKRTLQSLACAKLRPLTKHPKGKDINDSDTFTVNVNFDHPKYRVKINQIQLKETKEENKETHMRVAEDRNFECQAAIVRIMKSRKTISHPELVSETIKATISRGVLAVADIKKNIDRLIEKDYMEREDGNMYSYVA